MNRFVLLTFAVFGWCGSATIADDYLLRVDAIEYVDKPASEEDDPKGTILRSIEVVARPESAFHSKVNTGTQTLVVAGNLRPADCGGFRVQIRYLYSIDTGLTVPTKDGGNESVCETSAFQTNIRIAVGDSVTLGGFDTKVSDLDQPERHSKIRYVMRLTKYTPTDD